MSFDLFGNPVEEQVQDNSEPTPLERIKDARNFLMEMEGKYGKDSISAQVARASYDKLKKELNS